MYTVFKASFEVFVCLFVFPLLPPSERMRRFENAETTLYCTVVHFRKSFVEPFSICLIQQPLENLSGAGRHGLESSEKMWGAECITAQTKLIQL